jgi:hypothetical protein
MEANLLQWAASTYPALLCFGDAIMIWRLLDMARIAQKRLDNEDKTDFYMGKVLQATYFTDITIPSLLGRLETAGRPVREVVDIPEGAF